MRYAAVLLVLLSLFVDVHSLVVAYPLGRRGASVSISASFDDAAPLTSDTYNDGDNDLSARAVVRSLSAALTMACALLFAPHITDMAMQYVPPPVHAAVIDMVFENGPVQLDDPLRTFESMATLGKLKNPRLLGNGGGGAVFAYDRSIDRSGTSTSSRKNDAQVVVKVSWVRSSDSVQRECQVLNILQTYHVFGVERCLASSPYPSDARRSMIVMEPVMENSSVASVDEIDPKLQPHAVRCIIQTLAQMLAAGVVTTDVQPLISILTGDVLFIDLTEAKLIVSEGGNDTISFLDLALASSFCSEMLGLIPKELESVASDALLQELRLLAKEGNTLNKELYELLKDQCTFASRDVLEWMASRIEP